MDMWKCHTQAKQLPVPDEDSQVFWEGCRHRRLLVQQCDDCAACRFPPAPMCPYCLSFRATWQDDSGEGEVLTFCVYHSEIAGPAWRADLPYTVAVILLQHSGVKILSNLICDDPGMVRVGLPVRVMFETVNARITLPKFVPVLEAEVALSA